MQAARRSATRRRCSTSRNTRMPPSDDNRPPSNLATTDLPETGDRPGSGSIRSIMAGVVSRKWRGLASTTKSYAKSEACATSANLRCIMRARRFQTSSGASSCVLKPRSAMMRWLGEVTGARGGCNGGLRTDDRRVAASLPIHTLKSSGWTSSARDTAAGNNSPAVLAAPCSPCFKILRIFRALLGSATSKYSSQSLFTSSLCTSRAAIAASHAPLRGAYPLGRPSHGFFLPPKDDH